jgi:hypothetical protein
MSQEAVLCAMKEGVWYLPETVPLDLIKATIRSHLNSLSKGMVVVKKVMPIEENGIRREKRQRGTRAFYMSLQKALPIE